jgi:hypothetical protein
VVKRGLGSSLLPVELASVGFRRFRGNKTLIFHCARRMEKEAKSRSVSY